MVARRLLIACLTTVLLATGLRPASAQNSLYADIDYWLVQLEDRNTSLIPCFAELRDRRVRFKQIIEDDPFLSAPVRERLNALIEEAIPRRWSMRSSEVVGGAVREGVLPGTAGRGQVSGEDRLADLYTSQIIVEASVARNYLDVARLKILVEFRRPDGSLCNSTSNRWHFDIATLDRAKQPSFSARAINIYDLDATLRDGVRRTPPSTIPPEEAVPFTVKTDFAGSDCVLSGDAMRRDLLAAAVSAVDPTASALVTRRRSYIPIDGKTAATMPHMQVVVTRAVGVEEADADSTAAVEFVWRSGDERSPGVSRIVALPRHALEHCQGTVISPLDTFLANARNIGRYSLRMNALADPFTVGDPLVINFAVDEPVYAYCWVLLEEGAVVLFPHRDALARKPLTARTYRIPADFYLPDIPLQDEGTAIFHCFVGANPLPQPLVDRWLSAHRAQAMLAWPAAEAMSRAFREIPNISEVWAWVRAVAK
ncbi:hypothetical protein [Acuticoccus mangrovi]|uniref:DUF4384 domain-containing protein n=1 Tax=Acuticoccus mangrovi TaxID=2796142 RepID=A0A934IMT3_9HYPH|nr:hypothetical protein [Acuticoccus mangrovi]MBJ3774279.1 hypothetical protein [Acuticoccus mangrovi]